MVRAALRTKRECRVKENPDQVTGRGFLLLKIFYVLVWAPINCSKPENFTMSVGIETKPGNQRQQYLSDARKEAEAYIPI